MNLQMPTPHIVNTPETVAQLLQVAKRAHAHVPWYQRHFAHVDFSAPTLQLTDLPLLEKEQARNWLEELVRSDYVYGRAGELIEYTSGSTGIPLQLVRTQAEIIRCARALWHARAAFFPGVIDAPGVRLVPAHQQNFHTGSKTTQRKGIFPLSTAGWRADTMEKYIDEINALRPAWLTGPPALLSLLAQGLRQTAQSLRTKLIFIESNSDWLSPEASKLLAEIFDCPVANHYGSQETYTIAYTCPQGQMHLVDDCVLAELHARTGTDEYELVVSSLVFETMPFIRYRIGDIVQPENRQCTCTMNTPVLGQIRGRIGELIAGTALVGHVVFYDVVNWLTRSLGSIEILHYRVYQTSLSVFDVQLVLKENEMAQEVCFQFQDIASVWLHDAHFNFEIVDTIELTPRGKLQSFICCC